MSKVYILLRNNKQMGPYSLDELVQLGLKPYDLVWVEGKTACWLYPSEINELKPYAPEKKEDVQTKSKPQNVSRSDNELPFQPVAVESSPVQKAAPSAKVYVSLPTKPAEPASAPKPQSATPLLEQRAEELRQRIMAHAEAAKVKSEVDPSAAQSLEQKAEELRRRAMAHTSEATIKSEVDPSAALSLEQKAEELRRRAMAHTSEAAIKSEVDPSAALSLEQKAEELRRRAMAHTSEATIKSEVDPSAAQSLEQKAEELRRRAMANTSEATIKSEVDPSAAQSLEQKAEELRRRAMAHTSEATIKSEVDPSAALSLEQRAEEVRKRALGHTVESKVKSEADASSVQGLEQKAEELRKRALARITASATTPEVAESAQRNPEQKAEALRERALAGNGKATAKTERNTAAGPMLGQSAQAARKKVAAINSQLKTTSKAGALLVQQIEKKAGALKKTALAHTASAKAELASAVQGLRQKAEELKKAALAHIESFKTPAPKAPPAPSSPAKIIENGSKAAALLAAQNAVAAAASKKAPVAPTVKETVQPKYARPLEAVESDYNPRVYQRKVKKKRANVSAIGTAVLFIGLCFAGVYFAFFDKADKSQGFTVVPSENRTGAEPGPSPDQPSAEGSNTTSNDGLPPADKPIHHVSSEKGTEIKNDPGKLPSAAAVPAAREPKDKVAEKRPAPVVNKPVAEAAAKKNGEIVVSAPPARKPGAENTVEEVQPGGTIQENVERKAKRRGEEVPVAVAPQVEKIDLSGFIDLISSESAGNWMMGVRGVKLTLLNRSQQTVRQANIEVRYYNEHEEVLEKKIVNVVNIQPERSVLVSVPDHRLADHADYKLLSASN